MLQNELGVLQLRITKVDSKLVEAQKSLREIVSERGRLMADSPTEHTGGRLGPMDEVEAIVRQLREAASLEGAREKLDELERVIVHARSPPQAREAGGLLQTPLAPGAADSAGIRQHQQQQQQQADVDAEMGTDEGKRATECFQAYEKASGVAIAEDKTREMLRLFLAQEQKRRRCG